MGTLTARVRYGKTGLARLIGHLDTIRALTRAIRRAGIEGVYSQGFSPRLKLSFGPALPLGFTSECEFFDIKLRPASGGGVKGRDSGDPSLTSLGEGGPPSAGRRRDAESIRDRLQSEVPEGLFVEEVEVLEGSPLPLERAFWASEYEVEVPRHGGETARPRRHKDTDSEEAGDPLCVCGDDSFPGGAGMFCGGARGAAGPLLRAGWKENSDGQRVVSVVLREDASGKGSLKETLSDVLGISRESLERCRIHKKRVYAKGENLSSRRGGTPADAGRRLR